MQAFLKFKSELWRHVPQVTFATENIARKCNELMDESNDVTVRVELGIFDDQDQFRNQIAQKHFHDILNRLELCNRWLPRTSLNWSLYYTYSLTDDLVYEVYYNKNDIDAKLLRKVDSIKSYLKYNCNHKDSMSRDYTICFTTEQVVTETDLPDVFMEYTEVKASMYKNFHTFGE